MELRAVWFPSVITGLADRIGSGLSHSPANAGETRGGRIMKRTAVFWMCLCACTVAVTASGENNLSENRHKGHEESTANTRAVKVVHSESLDTSTTETTPTTYDVVIDTNILLKAITVVPNPTNSPSKNTDDSNGLLFLQGMEFLSSHASDKHDALLDDGNYFMQLFYNYRFPEPWTNCTAGASVYFHQDFVDWSGGRPPYELR